MYILRCSSAFNGRAPTRPKTPIWLPDSSTARSRSTPFEIARRVSSQRQLEAGDQSGRRPRAEAGVSRRLGRRELHDAQAVLAVGQVGKLADVGDAELHVVQVVDAAAGVKDLVDPRLRRALDVEDDEPFGPGRDIGVGSREVDAASISHGQRSTRAGDARGR